MLPAEITTSASPLAASLHMTAIELSGLLRIASTGESSIETIFGGNDRLVAGFVLGREAAGGEAVLHHGFVADEVDDVAVVEQRRGLPASLENGMRERDRRPSRPPQLASKTSVTCGPVQAVSGSICSASFGLT